MTATKERGTKRAGAGMSDEAVRRATGKDWAGWVRTLVRSGAAKMSHAEIARMLEADHGLSAWWSQSVTVGYERLTGRREKHQVAGGYSASVTRTLAVSAAACERAWRDARKRKAWLAERIAIRASATPGVVRFAWEDGSDVEVRLVAKGEEKTQVAVQVRKLRDAKAVAGTKKVWGERLAALGASMA